MSGDTVYTSLSTTQPTSNAGYSSTLATPFPEQTPVSPTNCTSDNVTPLDNLVVAPCSSPLKADTPCSTTIMVPQPPSHTHAATDHTHVSTQAHAPTHVHSTHAHVPMHAYVAATPPDPTYTTLSPITHYSGTASIASMTDYTYSSPYTQYPSTYPAYGYGTGGLLNMGNCSSYDVTNIGVGNNSSSSTNGGITNDNNSTNNSSNLSNNAARLRTLQSPLSSSACLSQDLGT
ncbi:uncharacterized protein [Panulirus ornatus]|uniref:uncharacterized protein n=1 Tax=Panulirus ornatus TaxID=150431 RepID=UPI003A83DBCB